jgi:hypothetical protein
MIEPADSPAQALTGVDGLIKRMLEGRTARL